MVPAAVCKDNKASLLVHLRDEALDFSGSSHLRPCARVPRGFGGHGDNLI